MALHSALTSSGRILKNTTETIEVTVYDAGTVEDPTGTPTYTIVDAAGTSVATGNVTVTGGSSGKLTINLAAQTTVKLLTVAITGTWNTATQIFTHSIEVVGGHLFTEADARTFDGSAMSDTSVYTDAAIAKARDSITDQLESLTGVSWVPRYKRYTTGGSGTRELWLPNHQVNTLLSATINGTAVTVGDVTVDTLHGRLYHEGQNWTAPTHDNPLNVAVEYEHGFTYLKDGVDRIALLILRSQLVRSNIPDRAERFSDDLGTYALGMWPPEVTMWLKNHDERLPV